MNLIKHFKINKIFDVGANIGNYALLMYELGFNGEIVSFEPLEDVFRSLNKHAQKYKNWLTVNIALGNFDGETTINIAGNYDSSSILEMLPSHIKSAPHTSYVGKEKIKINKIDTIINNYYKEGDKLFLKIDTQGFEKKVLEGAVKSLSKIQGIQLEMSLLPLYNGEMLFLNMVAFLKGKGFKLYSLENGFSDPQSGQLLQVDGIFFR